MFEFIPYRGSDQNLPDRCYLIASNGIFIKKKNEVYSSIVKLDQIRSLSSLKEGAEYELPQLGRRFLMKTWRFFREVYLKYRTEAVMFIYYNTVSNEYEAYVPEQEVTSGHTKNLDVGRVVPQRENCILVGTIHSHASMTAFHSSIDDADEEFFDGLHITFGKLDNEKEFDLSVSIVINGKRFAVDTLKHLEGIIKNDEKMPSEDDFKDKVAIGDDIVESDTTIAVVPTDDDEQVVVKEEEVKDSISEPEKVIVIRQEPLPYGGNPDSGIDKFFNKVLGKLEGGFRLILGKKKEENSVSKIDDFHPEFVETPEIISEKVPEIDHNVVELEDTKVSESKVKIQSTVSPEENSLPVTSWNPSPWKNRYYSALSSWRSKNKLYVFDQDVILSEEENKEVEEWLERVSMRTFWGRKKKVTLVSSDELSDENTDGVLTTKTSEEVSSVGIQSVETGTSVDSNDESNVSGVIPNEEKKKENDEN